MAKRLHTRLSAGAALVTGIGMMGIASAVPAQADVKNTLEYTCSAPDQGITFAEPWLVNLSIDAPDQVEPGGAIPAGAVTAVVTPDTQATELMQGLGVEYLEGTANTSYSLGGGESHAINLTVDRTDVPASGPVSVTGVGQSTAETAPEQEGTVDIVAGDFTAALANQDGFVFNIECTAPEDATVGSITVGESTPEPEPTDPEPTDPAPETDDWFNEPSSIPVRDNVITVTGDATHAGVLSVVMLDGDSNELNRLEWNLTEGSNENTATLVEGTDYVRLVSQECVDVNGNDETVEDSGCNVLYTAPWSETDATDNGDDEGDTGTDAGDDTGTDAGDDTSGTDAGDDTNGTDAGDDTNEDPAGTPQVPEVVQTDGLTPAMTSQEDSSAALALGGLLLAGAGAGSVLVMRRRAQQH